MKWKMPIWESKQKSRTFHFFGGSFQVESDSEQDFFSNDLSDVLSTRIAGTFEFGLFEVRLK
jgi:uncharacterized membrane protein YcjF (UPF0283 family)